MSYFDNGTFSYPLYFFFFFKKRFYCTINYQKIFGKDSLLMICPRTPISVLIELKHTNNNPISVLIQYHLLELSFEALDRNWIEMEIGCSWSR